MRVLHITFRYGREVYGGAELYFRKITENLYNKGINIDVCTTKSSSLTPFIKSGTFWNDVLNDENINGIDIFRFPVKNPNRYISFMFEKLIQNRLDKEENHLYNLISKLVADHCEVQDSVLAAGWNNLERYGSLQMRWTKKYSEVVIKDYNIQEVSFSMKNDKGINAEFIIETSDYRSSSQLPTNGDWSRVTIALPGVSGAVRLIFSLDRAWSPLRDIRTLGISISDISYRTDKSEKIIDMGRDYRKLFVSKGIYIDHLTSYVPGRPIIYSHLFDYMRGPRSPRMEKWLEKNISNYDLVMAQMFPFNTIKYSMIAKKKGVPLLLMPLLHVDDEFYHWPHYYRFLRQADGVLAISKYSDRNFFDKIGVNSIFVGAGIDPKIFLNSDIDGNLFREKYSLNNKRIILTVSRKSSSKRYDYLIRAVSIVRNNIKDAHLVMIGPDEDNVPINSIDVTYLGKVSDEDLANAYDACDVFAMMSESESFGMVFCEAWSRKKPVIGNIYCGAVASLIDQGIDGYLCKDENDLAEKIQLILEDSKLANRLGSAGFRKTIDNYTWDKVTEKTYKIYYSKFDRPNY